MEGSTNSTKTGTIVGLEIRQCLFFSKTWRRDKRKQSKEKASEVQTNENK